MPARFGRGRPATLVAIRSLSARPRRVIVKAQVVRHTAGTASLPPHLDYLRRDGIGRGEQPGCLFDAEGGASDPQAFAARCAHDRHHFRFIVSPEDGFAFADLRAFTRELMSEMERDLGTRLDWTAIDHWNTEHPHVHIVMRGRSEDKTTLLISPEYITRGMRARAQQLATLELGSKCDPQLAEELAAGIEADRWTKLDRSLAGVAERNDGVINLRCSAGLARCGPFQVLMVGRMRKLERLGLAAALGPARWRLSADAEAALRGICDRAEIINRMHRALAEQRVTRSIGDFVVHDIYPSGLVGRLIHYGLDNQARQTAYAIIDGIDGRAHHLRLPDLKAFTDARVGCIVELGRSELARGRPTLVVHSEQPRRSELPNRRAKASGRRYVADRNPDFNGFGRQARAAVNARREGEAVEARWCSQAPPPVFAGNCGNPLPPNNAAAVAQTCGEAPALVPQSLELAAVRWAMAVDGPGFRLVPQTATRERHRGRQAPGTVKGSAPDWNNGRTRGLSIG